MERRMQAGEGSFADTRLLLVDDEEDLANTMAKVFAPHFADVETAFTARDAVAALRLAVDEAGPSGLRSWIWSCRPRCVPEAAPRRGPRGRLL
jgi:hypothetical protein